MYNSKHYNDISDYYDNIYGGNVDIDLDDNIGEDIFGGEEVKGLSEDSISNNVESKTIYMDHDLLILVNLGEKTHDVHIYNDFYKKLNVNDIVYLSSKYETILVKIKSINTGTNLEKLVKKVYYKIIPGTVKNHLTYIKTLLSAEENPHKSKKYILIEYEIFVHQIEKIISRRAVDIFRKNGGSEKQSDSDSSSDEDEPVSIFGGRFRGQDKSDSTVSESTRSSDEPVSNFRGGKKQSDSTSSSDEDEPVSTFGGRFQGQDKPVSSFSGSKKQSDSTSSSDEEYNY